MAKGNLLLGTAGNSVGDVVMYRREGAQVSRVRVRKVKNPKTAAQCLQRSAFSPAAKFYSPLAIVLEKSFEGLSKSKSYNKFLKEAVSYARANNWLLKKGTGFFPLPYKLSQGSLPALAYNMNSGGTAISLPAPLSSEAPTTVGAFSQVFVDNGYKNDDIVTIILVGSDNQTVNAHFAPMAVQFKIDTTSSETIANGIKGISMQFSAGTLNIQINHGVTCAGAIIVARWENEKWRRSTQSLAVSSTILTAIADTDFQADAIASYGATDAAGNPLVYLDGETVNPQ